jgi:CheY-like chemotaxis protein
MHKKRILVVDDEPIIGLAFQRELEGKGYNIDSVLSGQEAFKAVKQEKYDLVFIDKVMPGIDGIGACRKISKISPDSVLIFMTGYLDKQNILKEQEFIDAGGRSYYLYKPFSKGELLFVTQKALKEKADQQSRQ